MLVKDVMRMVVQFVGGFDCRSIQTLAGHTDGVYCVCVLANGKWPVVLGHGIEALALFFPAKWWIDYV